LKVRQTKLRQSQKHHTKPKQTIKTQQKSRNTHSEKFSLNFIPGPKFDVLDDDVTTAQFDDDTHTTTEAPCSIEVVVAKHYLSQQQLSHSPHKHSKKLLLFLSKS